MNSHKKQPEIRSAEDVRAKKIKLAESGIIAVLVVSTCVYLGIRFAQQPLDEPTMAAASSPRQTPATVHGATEPTVVHVPLAKATHPDAMPQPGAQGAQQALKGHTVPAQGTKSMRAPLNIREVMPEVPIYVTYTSAEKMYFEGHFAEAAEMFAEYCDRHPGNTWGHYMRGLSLWKAGHPEKARHALETALRLQPDHLKSLVNLARIELDLSEYNAALKNIERALDVAPHHHEALRVLGRVYHQINRPDTAAATYLQVLRLKPDDAWTLNNLGLIYIEREQFGRALPVLARACELAPDIAVIRNNLGTALERTGHPSQAMTEYENAMRLGSHRGEENFVRLDAMIMPINEPSADLTALAASWSESASSIDAVAAVITDKKPNSSQ